MSTRVILDQSGIQAVLLAGIRVRDQVTEEIADDVRRYAPVLTGDLRSTVRTDLGGPAVSRIWYGDVAAGIDYHLYQEFGTSRMAAQPALRPAVYQYRGAR